MRVLRISRLLLRLLQAICRGHARAYQKPEQAETGSSSDQAQSFSGPADLLKTMRESYDLTARYATGLAQALTRRSERVDR